MELNAVYVKQHDKRHNFANYKYNTAKKKGRNHSRCVPSAFRKLTGYTVNIAPLKTHRGKVSKFFEFMDEVALVVVLVVKYNIRNKEITCFHHPDCVLKS